MGGSFRRCVRLAVSRFAVVLWTVGGVACAAQGIPPVKVAIIAFEQGVVATAEGQRVTQAVLKKFEPLKSKIDAQAAEVESLKNQLKALSANTPDEQRAALIQTIDTKEKELNRDAQAASDAYNSDLQEAYGKVAQKFGTMAVQYCQDRGFTLLLNTNGTEAAPNPTVWWLPTLDVTQAMIDYYNAGGGSARPAKYSEPQVMVAKVANVDFEDTVAATNEGKLAVRNTQNKFATWKTRIDRQAAEVESLKSQLRALPANAPDEQRASLSRRTEAKEKELNRDTEEANNAYQKELQEAYEKVANKVGVAMVQQVQASGYTLLVNKALTAKDILWSATGIDAPLISAHSVNVSATVLQAYNAMPGHAEPPPQVASTAKPVRTEAKTPPAAAPSPAPRQVAAAAARPREASRGFSKEPVTSAAQANVNIPHNYALVFAIDDYTYWPRLQNPIPDADAFVSTLKSLYGFETEEVRNPTNTQILTKLTEYLHHKFEPQDQLLIFFSGHGYFDTDLGKGFLVPKNALRVADDVGHLSLLAHETVMGYVNRIPARHVVLVLDACFAGTMDRRVADSGLKGDASMDFYAHATLPELLARKEPKRTRRYLTSGGKDFVPDGQPGHHSPFMSAMLVALNEAADRKGCATLGDLERGLEGVRPEPLSGNIADDNDPGADFILLTPEAIRKLNSN